MKFLRLAFYVLIAQLVLSGCAGEAVEETSSSSSSSSSEINFDAYVGRNASTRAGINNIDSLKGKGFGVFARYNHNGNISSLMDNEHVTWEENHWKYTNTRYWPNEGSVDFYAFAPYHQDVELVSPYSNSNKADSTYYIEFTSSTAPVDLVWGAQIGKKAPISPTDSKVKFQFKHALARLSFDITANQDLEENGAVITVDSVKLYGDSIDEDKGAFDITGYLNLKIGVWDSIVGDVNSRAVYTWTPTGLENGTSFKLSASQLDHTCKKIENAPNSYLCIIPQVKYFPFYLKITYKVRQGDFEEKVTVKKNLLDVRKQPGVSNPSFPFEKGKAYVFHLKLSLDPINFYVTTTVVDWKEGKNE